MENRQTPNNNNKEQPSLKDSVYSEKSLKSESAIKHFSILPDLVTGWRPKANIIPPPILIKYK
jgi:hypothetical protein